TSDAACKRFVPFEPACCPPERPTRATGLGQSTARLGLAAMELTLLNPWGMSQRILITGGAGFIGSHLADELLSAGYAVRALDSLVSQVHERHERPEYLDEEVELVVGDVRNRDVLIRALDGVAAVFHLAAQVGVGQSMYRIADYTST